MIDGLGFLVLNCPREGSSLRRLVWEGGDAFRLETDVPSPIPSKRDYLIRVRAVGICGTDIHILNGDLQGVRPPLVLGHEISGEVSAVGSETSHLKVGDRVTIDSVVGCGACYFCLKGSRQFCKTGFEFGITKDGGCQDYLVVPEKNVFPISEAITFEEGAILDMEVYSALKRCGVARGDVALVAGDGPAGLIACQLLRYMGAGKVILSGQSEGRIAKASQLGLADRVVNSSHEDLRLALHQETNGIGAQISVDCAGTTDSARDVLDGVMLGGTVLLYGVYRKPLRAVDLNQIVLKNLRVFGALPDRHGWESVIGLVETGKLRLKSLITHRFELEEAKLAFDSVRRRKDGLVKAVFVL